MFKLGFKALVEASTFSESYYVLFAHFFGILLFAHYIVLILCCKSSLVFMHELVYSIKIFILSSLMIEDVSGTF